VVLVGLVLLSLQLCVCSGHIFCGESLLLYGCVRECDNSLDVVCVYVTG
jgi:hypothetical protein